MGTLVFQATLGGAVNIIGPNISSTLNLTLPSVDGSSGQTWTTNGSGLLTFGTLGIAGGGTGQITANAALNALLPAQTSNANKYLQTNGTNTSWDAISLSTADITGVLPTANGGTNLSSFTSGGVVYASSSSALATGSGLNFNGSTLSILTANNSPINLSSSSASSTLVQHTNSNASVDLFYRFRQNGGAGNFYDLTMEGSTNAFTIDYNDNERLRIDSSGNVGIGTSSPAYRLEVVRAASSPAAATFRTSGFADDNVSTVFLQDDTANAIGVGGRIAFRGLNDVGSYTSFATIQGAKENSTTGNNAGAMVFKTQPNGGTLTEYMRLTSTGNVGIGTSSPASKLDVVGSASFSGNVGVGDFAAASTTGLNVRFIGNLTSTDIVGISNSISAPATASGSTIGVYSSLRATATSGSRGFLSAFYAEAPSMGAGSTASAMRGLYVTNQGNAAINNAYGVYIEAQSGSPTVNQGLRNLGTSRLDGNVGLNTTPATSGTGITFPATQSASSDANTLDDYEEGTATVTLTGGTTPPVTPPTTTAYYTKIGNLVTVSFLFANVDNTGAVGLVKITGMPFAQTNASRLGSIANNRGPNQMSSSYLSGTELYQVDYAGNTVNWSSFGAGIYLFVTITYQT